MSARNILIFGLSTLLLLGCSTSKGNNKKSYRQGRTARAGTNTGGPTASNGKVWGTVTKGNQSQNAFQAAVNALLKPQGVTPGYVSGDYNQTGIAMWGNAESTNGAINVNNNGQNYSIAKSSARIHLKIFDEYVGQISNGKPIPSIVVNIDSNSEGFITAGGYIQGNYSQIAFQDDLGWIILDGNFNSNQFSGNVWFGAGDGQMSLLGRFSISTCGFFRCY